MDCDWCKRHDKETKEFKVVYFDNVISDSRRVTFKENENVCEFCQSGPFIYVDKDNTIKMQYKKLTFEETIDIAIGPPLKMPWDK